MHQVCRTTRNVFVSSSEVFWEGGLLLKVSRKEVPLGLVSAEHKAHYTFSIWKGEGTCLANSSRLSYQHIECMFLSSGLLSLIQSHSGGTRCVCETGWDLLARFCQACMNFASLIELLYLQKTAHVRDSVNIEAAGTKLQGCFWTCSVQNAW